MIMNENIDLCEILKDCPKGTKFYSPLYGEVTFLGISDNVNDAFPIKTLGENRTSRTFTSDGRYDPFNKECLLFPSKEQRDWNKWKCSKPKFDPKTLKPFDKVLIYQGSYWIPAIFTYFNTHTLPYKMVYHNILCKEVIPYTKETEYLVGTELEAPEYYRYWED